MVYRQNIIFVFHILKIEKNAHTNLYSL